MRGCNWLIGLVLLGVGWPGLVAGQDVDMEEVRRRAEKYEREAAEEAAKKAPAPKPRPKPESAPKPQPKPVPTVNYDHEAWKSAERCGTAACFRAYLRKHPQGQYAEMARARLEAEAPSPAPVERPRPTMTGPEMVRIPAGCFQMGSPESEEERRSDERQHRVCVEDFEIGKYEVTQRQWESVMGNNPSLIQGCPDCPVEQVSWDDIQEYLSKLNAKTGKNYRLPTEAEWEYACRGGAAGERYCGGDDVDQLAWYGEIYRYGSWRTHSVGQKASNNFGLYDMSGNVSEWTCSHFELDYGGAEQGCSIKALYSFFAVRGGSSLDPPDHLRSANCYLATPENRMATSGFRLARSL